MLFFFFIGYSPNRKALHFCKALWELIPPGWLETADPPDLLVGML